MNIHEQGLSKNAAKLVSLAPTRLVERRAEVFADLEAGGPPRTPRHLARARDRAACPGAALRSFGVGRGRL
jgi:hypothetical protein